MAKLSFADISATVFHPNGSEGPEWFASLDIDAFIDCDLKLSSGTWSKDGDYVVGFKCEDNTRIYAALVADEIDGASLISEWHVELFTTRKEANAAASNASPEVVPTDDELDDYDPIYPLDPLSTYQRLAEGKV